VCSDSCKRTPALYRLAVAGHRKLIETQANQIAQFRAKRR
jgi:hypothetical protein